CWPRQRHREEQRPLLVCQLRTRLQTRSLDGSLDRKLRFWKYARRPSSTWSLRCVLSKDSTRRATRRSTDREEIAIGVFGLCSLLLELCTLYFALEASG